MTLSSATTFAGLVNIFISYLNMGVQILIGVAVVLFMYSAFRYVLKSGESKGKGPERAALLWGLIALFVLVSVWGILRLMCNTLFSNPSCRAGGTIQVR